jgi:hypothetical protein
MERPMTASTHRPLDFGQALARQFALLWASRRPLLLGLALLAVLVLAGEPWSDDVLARLLTPWPVWLGLAGPVWAFAVFHNEGPSARMYHWSMPVNRTVHTLARLGAGILWLWLLLAGLVAVGAIMAVLAETILEPLLVGDWGLFVAMVGALGETILQLGARLTGHDGANPGFVLTYWWPATVAWTAVLAAVVGFLATRHPDTLPRLRRKG